MASNQGLDAVSLDARTNLIGVLADVAVAALAATFANLVVHVSQAATMGTFVAAYLLSPLSVMVCLMAARRKDRADVYEMCVVKASSVAAALVEPGMLIPEPGGIAAEITDVARTGDAGLWVRIRTSTGRQHLHLCTDNVTIMSPAIGD